jgi:hypothetical protein
MARADTLEKPRTASPEKALRAMRAELKTIVAKLSPERLRSALDFLHYLEYEDEESETLPEPDAEELADSDAFRRGDMSRFIPMEEAWRRLEAERQA